MLLGIVSIFAILMRRQGVVGSGRLIAMMGRSKDEWQARCSTQFYSEPQDAQRETGRSVTKSNLPKSVCLLILTNIPLLSQDWELDSVAGGWS